jgi:predicted oxidoreductase
MLTHPNPDKFMLLPYMHPNTAQITRWWIAQTIITDTTQIEPISEHFQQILPAPSSIWMDASPVDLAPLDVATLNHFDEPLIYHSKTQLTDDSIAVLSQPTVKDSDTYTRMKKQTRTKHNPTQLITQATPPQLNPNSRPNSTD